MIVVGLTEPDISICCRLDESLEFEKFQGKGK